jgi:hypothetical protein
MASNRKTSTPEVGYANPPRDTQFKKGVSGNPKGRPKGSISLSTVVQRTSREPVSINENGKRKIITKAEAALKQLSNKAASGDLRAIKELMILIRSAEEQVASESPAPTDLGETDLKVAQNIVARLSRSFKGDSK